MDHTETPLRQAKLHYIACRNRLREAEHQHAATTQLQQLHSQLAQALEALHQAEANCGSPPPIRQRLFKNNLSQQERLLRTELAYARADLQRTLRTNDQELAKETLKKDT